MHDSWNIDGDLILLEPWTGFTQFPKFNGGPLDGHVCSEERLAKIQATTRPDHLWPEYWSRSVKICLCCQNLFVFKCLETMSRCNFGLVVVFVVSRVQDYSVAKRQPCVQVVGVVMLCGRGVGVRETRSDATENTHKNSEKMRSSEKHL